MMVAKKGIESPKEVVMTYINALYDQKYDLARSYLGDNLIIKGPAGEAFRSPDEFITMMKNQGGKHDMKKIFIDGNDVCLLYNFISHTVTTFFCSWYQVKDGKIVSIQTVFDTRAFTDAAKKK